MSKGHETMKQQIAIENLTTYAWALLILAIVVYTLFKLNLFSAISLTPYASPGACHIARPNGPGTTQYLNLAGICNSEIPKYIPHFSGTSNSYILLPYSRYLNPNNLSGMTLAVWVYDTEPASGNTEASIYSAKNGTQSGNTGASAGFQLYTNAVQNPKWTLREYYNYAQNSGIARSTLSPVPSITTNNWVFLTITANGTTGGVSCNCFSIYANGSVIASTTGGPFGFMNWPLFPNYNATEVIGAEYANVATQNNPLIDPFNGYITNLQIYNTTLSPNAIQELYGEGIGGVPVDLRHLQGWYPLNGNGYDYSGNNNNATQIASNIIFVQSPIR